MKKATKIHVTEEGVIFIDGFLADFDALNDAIEKDSIEISIASQDGYKSLSEEQAKAFLKRYVEESKQPYFMHFDKDL